jgi:hypothetical protein
VVFIASLKASLVGQPVPTGRVAFKEGNTTLATLPLRQGRAQFKISNLTVGEHKITATYSGDSHFYRKQAETLVQVVNP